MKLFGFDIGRGTRSLVPKEAKGALVPASPVRNMFGVVYESFAGAWQRNVTVDSPQNLLAFSAVYACVSRIAEDISKLRIKLMEFTDDGIWVEVERNSPYVPFLRKPNRYQTRIQFISQWVTSKLLQGNAYILKERDNRGIVISAYVLDPRQVLPLVADDGSVLYQIGRDPLSGNPQSQIVVPASEIIHDRMITLWHPLVGVTPIFACGASATQGIRIQANSAKFFENMSRPAGQLTSNQTIDDVTAARLKRDFEEHFSGGGIGRLFVGGDGLKFEPMAMTANDAQMVEQLRWTIEDVARCFHVPLHKIGSGANPSFNNISSLNQDYYNEALQGHIESIELLLDEGLALPSNYGTEIDLEGLLRMDPMTRAQTDEIRIRSGALAPNESRRKENLPPVAGGNSPMIQQQNYSLEALAKRDAKDDPFNPNPAPSAPAPQQTESSSALANEGTSAAEKADTTETDGTVTKSGFADVRSLADAIIARFTEVNHAA